VDIARLEPVEQPRSSILDQVERDARVRPAPPGQEPGQTLQHLGRGAEAQHARLARAQSPRALVQGLGAGEKIPSLADELFALPGEPHAAAHPVEEAHAEVVLERAHLAPQRGLAHAKSPGGPGEAARLGHGDQVPKRPQVDHCLSGIENSPFNAFDTMRGGA
jgi:hypothetical protein